MTDTVFIIGAGASKEANLPTGDELKNKIVELLDIRFNQFGKNLLHGNPNIVAALRSLLNRPDRAKGDINSYLEEAWNIRDAMPLAISIDNFIDNHRDNEKIALCGKLAIVQSILKAEEQSLLSIDEKTYENYYQNYFNLNYKNLKNTWYISFFKLITENCAQDDLKARFKSITLIIFNYDRCVEHFIYQALRHTYKKMSDDEVVEIVKCMNIYHPYGTVGNLPWIDDQNMPIGFGEHPGAEQLLKLTNNIKTFTEGTDSKENLEIQKYVRFANRIIFLGFAFHELNMQVITSNFNDIKDRPKNLITHVFATTYGISDSDTAVINNQIRALHFRKDLNYPTDNVKMINKPCNEFFAEFWRTLSFTRN
jgi:hypothetical protein